MRCFSLSFWYLDLYFSDNQWYTIVYSFVKKYFVFRHWIDGRAGMKFTFHVWLGSIHCNSIGALTCQVWSLSSEHGVNLAKHGTKYKNIKIKGKQFVQLFSLFLFCCFGAFYVILVDISLCLICSLWMFSTLYYNLLADLKKYWLLLHC